MRYVCPASPWSAGCTTRGDQAPPRCRGRNANAARRSQPAAATSSSGACMLAAARSGWRHGTPATTCASRSAITVPATGKAPPRFRGRSEQLAARPSSTPPRRPCVPRSARKVSPARPTRPACCAALHAPCAPGTFRRFRRLRGRAPQHLRDSRRRLRPIRTGSTVIVFRSATAYTRAASPTACIPNMPSCSPARPASWTPVNALRPENRGRRSRTAITLSQITRTYGSICT